MRMNSRYITKVGLIAALYAVLTYILPSGLSYGPVQFRLSEGLVLLPYAEPAAVLGLAIGCIISNLASPFGIIDIIAGSAATLIAAYLTHILRKTGKVYLAALPPIVVNGLGVSLYVSYFSRTPYWITVGYITLSEGIAVFGIAMPVLAVYMKYVKPRLA